MDDKFIEQLIKQMDGKIIMINPDVSTSTSFNPLKISEDSPDITMEDLFHERGQLLSFKQFTQKHSVDREYWERVTSLIKLTKAAL
ncbi:hypothetical protein POF51_26280 [Brevibacillus sp. AG]|uniref:hypothetical protein n=1 Tax=Brevibacillus sp. AG TaxID=3020891 RepID=UPI00232A7C78|nr:hypothetical protein [Brevibacillus sp. AG]MDC0764231.1 hypothetical protein [Brevibacillus sp. AG]